MNLHNYVFSNENKKDKAYLSSILNNLNSALNIFLEDYHDITINNVEEYQNFFDKYCLLILKTYLDNIDIDALEETETDFLHFIFVKIKRCIKLAEVCSTKLQINQDANELKKIVEIKQNNDFSKYKNNLLELEDFFHNNCKKLGKTNDDIKINNNQITLSEQITSNNKLIIENQPSFGENLKQSKIFKTIILFIKLEMFVLFILSILIYFKS